MTLRLAAFVAFTLLLTASVLAGPQEDLAAYNAAATEGLAAYKSGDMKAAEAAFRKAAAIAPQRSSILYKIAAVSARQGQTQAALDYLTQFAARGLTADLDADVDFASLKAAEGYAAVNTKIRSNAEPSCLCKVLFDAAAAPFLAEGIALDTARDRILVSGVHTRKIIAIRDGRASDFVTLLPEGLSPFGMQIVGKTLWVAAGIVPQSLPTKRPALRHAALLSFDLASGRLLRITFEASGAAQMFDDLAVGRDGTVYLSDSLGGSIYRLKPGALALTRIGAGKQFSSPQGMAESSDGRFLLVADYALGLVRLDLAGGTITAVTVPPDVTTMAMDGLVRRDASDFLATQNGTYPVRVVRFSLTADWSAVTQFAVVAKAAPQIADPSLIAADGDGALLVGVSQWASFDEESPQPVRPVTGFRIVKLQWR